MHYLWPMHARTHKPYHFKPRKSSRRTWTVNKLRWPLYSVPDHWSLGQIGLDEFFPGDFLVGHLVGQEEQQQGTGSKRCHGRVSLLVAIAATNTSGLGRVLEELGKVRLRFAPTFRGSFRGRIRTGPGALRTSLFRSRLARWSWLLLGSCRRLVFEKLLEALGRLVPPQAREQALKSIGDCQRICL